MLRSTVRTHLRIRPFTLPSSSPSNSAAATSPADKSSATSSTSSLTPSPTSQDDQPPRISSRDLFQQTQQAGLRLPPTRPSQAQRSKSVSTSRSHPRYSVVDELSQAATSALKSGQSENHPMGIPADWPANLRLDKVGRPKQLYWKVSLISSCFHLGTSYPSSGKVRSKQRPSVQSSQDLLHYNLLFPEPF